MENIYHINITVNDSAGAINSADFWLYVYDYPNVSSPAPTYSFSFEENVTSNLTFIVNHSVQDNLTYEFYIENFNKKNDISNIYDVNISKINNFIKNLINLSNNIINLIQNNILLNFLETLVYDSNLELIKYITNYNYFPKIKLNSFLPNTINKYKLNSDIPKTDFSLQQIPAGNYKLFKYINFYPEYNFSETSELNDKLVIIPG